MRCAYCSERKGKRECPALGAVCSACCGKHRRREIVCPPGCAFLPAAPERDDAHLALDRAQEALQRFAFDPARPGGALEALFGADRRYAEWETPTAITYVLYGHEDARGERPVDAFLRGPGTWRSPAERDALAAAAAAVPSLFEVRAVRRGEGLELADLVDAGPTTFVHERALTTQVEPGAVLLAWVMDFAGRRELIAAGVVPPAHVRVTREAFVAARARLAAARPDASPASCARRAVADAHRALREAVRTWVPRARSPEGHEVVPSWAVYEVRDREAVLTRLRALPDLLAREGGVFLWVGPAPPAPTGDEGTEDVPTHSLLVTGPDGQSAQVLGHVEVRAVRLTLWCQTRERLAAGRAQLERHLGGLARHCFDQHEALAELLARGAATAPDVDRPAAIPIAPGEDPGAALTRWLEAHPAEADRLEAAAAAHARASEAEEGPALQAAGAPPDRRALEPLPHERLALLVPGLGPVLDAIARDERTRPGWERRTIPPRRLVDDDAFQDLLQALAHQAVRDGADRAQALDEAETLGAHARYAVNHALHRRKTFWADEALAWALHDTTLDVPGACLRLPFPCAAFVFTDPRTRELADGLLELERLARRRPVTRLTVYALEGERRGDATELTLAFVFDRAALDDDPDDDWPYLVCRELVVRDEDRLDATLESRPLDAATRNEDPVFRAPETRALVHLAINALLYATSAGQPAAPLPPAAGGGKRRPRRGGGAPAAGKAHTDDDVSFLPGALDVRSVQALRALERTESGRTVLRRFMVRGHWRRPAPGWKDQRLRWIAPSWKGPDLGLIVGRDHRPRP